MVYVDGLRNYGVRYGKSGPEWCHCTADSVAELHTFAAQLGLKRRYFQDKSGGRWHYDLTAGMRAKAVALGAAQVTSAELVRVMRSR